MPLSGSDYVREYFIMSWLLFVAVALLVLWVTAQVFGWVLGAALNVFWIVALVLVVVWLFQRI